MTTWLAAGLLSLPLTPLPAPPPAQSPAVRPPTPPGGRPPPRPPVTSPSPPPAAPAVAAAPPDAVAYRPADEGWSIRMPKAWARTRSEADSSVVPEPPFSRPVLHLMSSGGEVKVQVVVKSTRPDRLSAQEKAKLMETGASNAEKDFGQVTRTKCDPKPLGLPESCLVEDREVRIGSCGQFQHKLTIRTIIADDALYSIWAGGEHGPTDAARAAVDSFRVEPVVAPRAEPAATTGAPRPAPGQPTAPPSAPAAAGTPAPALPELFESLGYTPRNVGRDREPVYRISFDRDGWTFHLTCRWSTDRRALRLFSNVGGDGLEPSRLSPSALAALLGENGKDRPACFSFDRDRKQLVLSTAIDPNLVSAAVLRERIDLLTAVIQETHPIWGTLAAPSKPK